MSLQPVLVWLRNDLRLHDNAAIAAAATTGLPVIPVFILDDDTPGHWVMGGASRWWLHGSLGQLARRLQEIGSRLVLRRGASVKTLLSIARITGAESIYWNRHAEPFWRQAEAALAEQATDAGVQTQAFHGSYLFDLGTVVGRSGKPVRIFSPFWRACLAAGPPPQPLSAPKQLRPPSEKIAQVQSDDLESWHLRPRSPDWASGLHERWTPGEEAARQRLGAFVNGSIADYATMRNHPEPGNTSELSPYLHFGEITARQIWQTVTTHTLSTAQQTPATEAFLREIGWREFCADTILRDPDLPDAPLLDKFASFPWRDDETALQAWRQGCTGYPIVDAGMRQLWQIGWMHNRVRMVVASFLVKHLLLPWQAGEAWFWDTLVDADLASNAAGWQWVAGSGTDAAPYFRVFNPVAQGEKFDAKGAYVRRWVPELRGLPDRWIHRPWQAPPLELATANVRLGGNYPLPIVDHAFARQRALAAFHSLKA